MASRQTGRKRARAPSPNPPESRAERRSVKPTIYLRNPAGGALLVVSPPSSGRRSAAPSTPDLDAAIAAGIEAALASLLPAAMAKAMAAQRPQVRPATWEETYAELKGVHGPPASAPRTWQRYVTCLRWLEAEATEGPATVSPATVQALIARWQAADYASFTIKSYLAQLRAACRTLAGLGLLAQSPWDLARFRVRAEAAHVRHLDREELVRLLRTADGELARAHAWRRKGLEKLGAARVRALVYLVAHTGLRKLEALTLRWADLRPANPPAKGGLAAVGNGLATLGGRTKTEASRDVVPVPERAWDVLAEWRALLEARLPDTPWVFPQWRGATPWLGGSGGNRATERVVAMGRRAGIPACTLKNLRHSWATHAESLWGLSAPVIQRVLRHTTTRTQEHYRHADQANLAALLGGISFETPE